MTNSYGGIDFGTSNSTVGVIRDGRPRLVALEEDRVTLPSAVFFNFEDDRIYYGRRAIEDYTLNSEGRLLRALKSVLGSSLVHEKTRIKARSIAFTEIIGLFLGHLKSRLDADAGTEVTRVVLGRPVHFVDGDEEADRTAQSELELAARGQGFRDIEFQFEPIAAALDYEQSVAREELALIVDIGGGTSDFSVVRVSPRGPARADRKGDVLANAGVHIGGTDFDRLISIAAVMPAFGYGTPTRDGKRNLPVSYFNDLATWQRINQLYSNKAMTDLRQIRQEAARPDLVERMIDVVRHRQGHALAGRVEQAKIELTEREVATIALPLTDDHVDVAVERGRMDEIIAPAVARVAETASATVRLAGLVPSQIETLFLTGGSAAMPPLHAAIRALFPGARIVEGDAFGSVGLGLALDARRKFG